MLTANETDNLLSGYIRIIYYPDVRISVSLVTRSEVVPSLLFQ